MAWLLGLRPAAAEIFTIGAENDAAPWSLSDGSGFVNDLVSEAFEAAGGKARLSILPYARCKALAQQGVLDGCFTTSRTAETDAGLLFPQIPVIAPRNVLYVKADSNLKGCGQAEWGRRIKIGFTHDYEYVDAIDTLRTAGSVAIDTSDSEIFSLRKLAVGRVDAALITTDEIKTIGYMARRAQLDGNFRVLCDYGALDGFVAFSQLSPAGARGRALFETGIQRLLAQGRVETLKRQWAERSIRLATQNR